MSEPLDESTCRRMLRAVDPDWTLREATPVERGFSRVARLTVDTDEGPREYVLKAAPEEGGGGGIPADARITAILDTHTDVPVPTVLGTVDDHDDLPAPYYLATALSGAAPIGNLDSLTVAGDAGGWREVVRGYADRELDRHADSRFASLHDDLRAWVDERIAALEGPFEPALCRNDHGLHNLLLDDGVAAMLDWAYTLATPPARVDAVAERHPLYAVLAATRLMNDFHNLPPELPDGTADAAAERLRMDVAATVGNGG